MSIQKTEIQIVLITINLWIFGECSGQIPNYSCTITNNYDPNAKISRIDTEQVWLYQPVEEWTYSHHPHIAFFRGSYYAIWSNGRRDEDGPGQRVLLSRSDNFNVWTKPAPLVDSQLGKDGKEAVLTSGGFHQYNGLLVAYFGRYEQDRSGTKLFAITTQDGINWSEFRDMSIPVIPNHGPRPTKTGRLIICGNTAFPHTDDPQGLSGWKMTGIYPADTANPEDNSFTINVVQKKKGWPVVLCEGAFYQSDNGTLNMMLRSAGDGYRGRLWITKSIDDGLTWSQPNETSFTDNCAKFDFGRLPDGRFYYVGNPDPDAKGKWMRCPLVLSISMDGIVFGKHYIIGDEHYEKKKGGSCKDGQYGYPHTMVHDGHLYVIVSRVKEAVEVIRIRLGDIK